MIVVRISVRSFGSIAPLATIFVAALLPANHMHAVRPNAMIAGLSFIGRTSPITFQVVGHLKTCLVLVGGYVLFTGKHIHKRQLQNNIVGVSVAMVGCVLYGHI